MAWIPLILIPTRIAKRDAARKRFEQKSGKEDKNIAIRERATVYKEKEKVRFLPMKYV